ncbi:MAG TPA: acetolactate synthase large subunit [Acidimicrobiales bacterium]|jgi:acetolactate synthase-1/2/3 large subunit
MNGAQALIRTLVACGVDTCFANPGTSEMHFVAQLDAVPEMRAVLGLFEGVVTGAADGYGRMADRPAATLLHLGPGLGNGIANLHNARRARTPVVNLVGDHATYHRHYDAPLTSDIESLARNVSAWFRSSASTAALPRDAAEAVSAARSAPGRVATMVLPADVSWDDGGVPAAPVPPLEAGRVPEEIVDMAARALRSGEPAAVLIGGRAVRERGLVAAHRAAARSGAKVLGETFPARLERGAGLPPLERLSYLAEFASAQLAGLRRLVVVDCRAPVSFFAYPGKPSDLVPDDCEVIILAGDGDDPVGALEALADAVGAAPDAAPVAPSSRPAPPTGALTGPALAAALGALLPEGAIVSDEAQTSGVWAPDATAGAPRHDWLTLCGGAIGQGMPLATGAAVACPDRPVISLQADGSAMYTLQSLWTQAREGLDVTTIICSNHAYAILELELSRVGVETPGPRALGLLDISTPPIDFVALARGMGVPATRPADSAALMNDLSAALREPGPHLIDVEIQRG